jgi:error-prone DNA polymerase
LVLVLQLPDCLKGAVSQPWSTIDYVELHCHSSFSLLDGASTPEELITRAGDLDMQALALTDHDALYGAIPFATAAEARGVRPIFGAELTLEDGRHLTLLVESDAGWRNLCTLISRARMGRPKGAAALAWADLDSRTDGLICLSGCRKGPIAAALRRWDRAGAFRAARTLRELFGPERLWIELQHHLRKDDAALIDNLVAVARHMQLGYVATNNVHYARRDGQPLHDLLTAIRARTPLDQLGSLRRPNSEAYLKTGGRLYPLFRQYPEALANTLRVAERCQFALRYGLQDLPAFPTPPGLDAPAFLAELCRQALPWRYGTPSERVCAQLQYELHVIARAGLANYFLLVWDIVRFARTHGIRCQGRGSAANSLVAYLLAISPIDPLAHDLVFERFLSDERPALPDIDIDFAADRREEVIQYIYTRYGHDHAALACTQVTFRARSALRDVARALDLPPALLGQAQQALDDGAADPPAAGAAALAAALCRQLDGLPRHLGQHSGGMVLMRSPLAERLPIEPARMNGRVVVQWDKDALEEAGLIKVDILGLRMLSAISEAVELVGHVAGAALDLDRLAFDDSNVYAMISQADTIGVFQVESRAQAQVLPRLQPRCMNDLIVAISLIRPGPLQGDMVHPYLRRRQRLEPVRYAHPLLQPALEETLGVILFQEQVLKVARDLAGFTAGQGEQLRRALGSKQAEARLDALCAAFLAGAARQGVPQPIAAAVFEQLRAFGGYAFPKSHAAAFAVLVYQSAWLKRYHAAAFFCALLNHQPMGFWPPSVLIGDAKRHGVGICPPDIHISAARCRLEGGAIRLGLDYVGGLGAAQIERIIAARPFADLADLCRRTRLPRAQVEQLVAAGALDGWGIARRQLLWQLGTLRFQADELELPIPHADPALPPQSRAEAFDGELAALGLSPDEQIMAFYRTQLDSAGVLSSAALEQADDGQRVRVAGLCVVHQAPPTAKGYHFLTLEDEWGMINVIVSPGLVLRDGKHLRGGRVLLAEGVAQREDAVINIIAQRVGPLGLG